MKILKKEILIEVSGVRVTKIEVDSPLIANRAKPGQFVVLMAKDNGERIPLTVVSTDKEKGIVTLIFQELGFTTKLLGTLKEGDSLFSFVGPLGHPTEIKKYGKVVLIGGGVGIAEIYPVAKAMKDKGNHVITIIGGRTKDLLILENELKDASTELHVTTDDGSYGKKGFTTDVLKDVIREGKPDVVYAVGPIPMMAKVSEVTTGDNVKTLVSLNALMVDGTGMCGCCRVSVGGAVKFSCIDGPEFDAHKVDWKELNQRSKIYEKSEKHICKLNKYE